MAVCESCKKKMMLRSKMKKVLREFDEGKLRSGSRKGPKVKKRDQAEAIAYSEANRAFKKKRTSKKKK